VNNDIEWLAELLTRAVTLPTRPGVAVVEVLGFSDVMRLCRVLHIRTEQEIAALLAPGHWHLVRHCFSHEDTVGAVVGILAREKPDPQERNGWMYLFRAAPAAREVLDAVVGELFESFERALQAEGIRLEPTQN
jgi:hypothetical protein